MLSSLLLCLHILCQLCRELPIKITAVNSVRRHLHLASQHNVHMSVCAICTVCSQNGEHIKQLCNLKITKYHIFIAQTKTISLLINEYPREHNVAVFAKSQDKSVLDQHALIYPEHSCDHRTRWFSSVHAHTYCTWHIMRNACPPNPAWKLKMHWNKCSLHGLRSSCPGVYIQSSLFVCLYSLGHSHPSVFLQLAVRCTAAGGGWVCGAESLTETTTHIKALPLVNMIINLYPLSLRVLPLSKHHSHSTGRKGRRWPQTYL